MVWSKKKWERNLQIMVQIIGRQVNVNGWCFYIIFRLNLGYMCQYRTGLACCSHINWQLCTTGGDFFLFGFWSAVQRNPTDFINKSASSLFRLSYSTVLLCWLAAAPVALSNLLLLKEQEEAEASARVCDHRAVHSALFCLVMITMFVSLIWLSTAKQLVVKRKLTLKIQSFAWWCSFYLTNSRDSRKGVLRWSERSQSWQQPSH